MRCLGLAFLALASATALFASIDCTSHPTTSECTPCLSAVDCEPGLDCSDGVCLRRCTSAADCPIGLGCEQPDTGARVCTCPGEVTSDASDQ